MKKNRINDVTRILNQSIVKGERNTEEKECAAFVSGDINEHSKSEIRGTKVSYISIKDAMDCLESAKIEEKDLKIEK